MTVIWSRRRTELAEVHTSREGLKGRRWTDNLGVWPPAASGSGELMRTQSSHQSLARARLVATTCPGRGGKAKWTNNVNDLSACMQKLAWNDVFPSNLLGISSYIKHVWLEEEHLSIALLNILQPLQAGGLCFIMKPHSKGYPLKMTF